MDRRKLLLLGPALALAPFTLAQAAAAPALMLADVYRRKGDRLSAIRCLERTIQIDARYNLKESSRDSEALTRLRAQTCD